MLSEKNIFILNENGKEVSFLDYFFYDHKEIGISRGYYSEKYSYDILTSNTFIIIYKNSRLKVIFGEKSSWRKHTFESTRHPLYMDNQFIYKFYYEKYEDRKWNSFFFGEKKLGEEIIKTFSNFIKNIDGELTIKLACEFNEQEAIDYFEDLSRSEAKFKGVISITENNPNKFSIFDECSFNNTTKLPVNIIDPVQIINSKFEWNIEAKSKGNLIEISNLTSVDSIVKNLYLSKSATLINAYINNSNEINESTVTWSKIDSVNLNSKSTINNCQRIISSDWLMVESTTIENSNIFVNGAGSHSLAPPRISGSIIENVENISFGTENTTTSLCITKSKMISLKNNMKIEGSFYLRESEISGRVIIQNGKSESIKIFNSDVSGDVLIFNNANISDSTISGNANIFESGFVGYFKSHNDFKPEKEYKSTPRTISISGYSKIFGRAVITGSPKISGVVNIYGESEISDEPIIYGRVNILDDARVQGKSNIYKEEIINKYEERYE